MTIYKSRNILLDGLVSYWSFDSNADDLHRNNNGTVYGATNTTGLINNCYDFDGVDDYISIPDDNSFDITDELSFSFWIKGTSNGTSMAGILDKRTGVGGDGGFSIQVDDGDRFLFRLDDGTNRYDSTNFDPGLEDNNWHHFVCIFKPNKFMKIYQDNELKINDTNSIPSSIGINSRDLIIGARWDRTSYYFDGKIDEIGIWNKILTENEIDLLYNDSSGLSYSSFSYFFNYSNINLEKNLISYWRLDETSGDAIDYYNSNNGTISGVTQGVSGIINNSYLFNGDDYVDFGDPSDLSGLKDLSISFWFYWEDNPSESVERIISKWGLSGQEFLFQLRSGNEVNVGIYGSDNLFNYADLKILNTWHHVVFSWNEEDNYLRIYHNGKIIKIESLSVSASDTSSDLILGKHSSSLSEFFKGKIDEVGIWNRILIDEEIKLLYNKGDGKKDSDYIKAGRKIGYNLLKDLVSYWNFNNNADDLHRNNNGFVSGATSNQSGIIDRCYSFDGSDDYIEVTDDNSLTLSDSISISLWANTTDGNGTMVRKRSGSSDSYQLNLVSNVAKFTIDTGSTALTLESNSINDGEWHNVIGTWNGQLAKLYVDNILVDSGNISGSMSNTSDSLFIGGSTAFYFEGKLDEIGIWNKALTINEIDSLYNNGFGLPYENFRY